MPAPRAAVRAAWGNGEKPDTRLARLAASLLVCLLGAFAADCRDSDWRSRGYADGFGGHPPQDLRLAPACAGFSQTAYLEGWGGGYDEWYRLMGSIGLD